MQAELWVQSHPRAPIADIAPKQRQISGSLPAAKSQDQLSAVIRNSLHYTGDASIAGSQMTCWSKGNRKCSPDVSQDKTRQRGQPSNMDTSLGFSRAASAFLPSGNVSRGSSSANADMNHQPASVEGPAVSDMKGFKRSANSEEIGWHQSNSSTYVGSYQECHQIAQVKKQTMELSSHALPFMPGERAAAVATSRIASTQYSLPSATDIYCAQKGRGKTSWGLDCQDGAWSSAEEVNWTDQRGKNSMHSDDWGLWKGAAKSSCKSRHTDAEDWEDGSEGPGKGWNNLCKGSERIPRESITRMMLLETRHKGNYCGNSSKASWWSGIPWGIDSMTNGSHEVATTAGESSGWEGNDGNCRTHDGWDAAYLGKGWGSCSRGWSRSGWDSKARGTIICQSSRSSRSSDWHADSSNEGIMWTNKGSNVRTGNSKMHGKSLETVPAYRAEAWQGVSDYGRSDDWLKAYEDVKRNDSLHWEDKQNNELQGGWKDEWRSEWRGLEDTGKVQDNRRAGNWRQHGEWRQEQHQGRTLRAKIPRDHVRHIAQHITSSKNEHGKSSRQVGGDGDVVGRKTQPCCLTTTLDSKEDSCSAPGSVSTVSRHQQVDRKSHEESTIHVRQNSPAPTVITVSETESDEESKFPMMGAARNAKGQGKARAVGDEAATRNKLRRMWQQQREAERRKTRPHDHELEDDDDRRSMRPTLD